MERKKQDQNQTRDLDSDTQLAVEHKETQRSHQQHTQPIRQWTNFGDKTQEDGKTTQETVSLNKALQLNGLNTKILK